MDSLKKLESIHGRRQGGGTIRAREVKIMREKSMETTESNSWKLRNSSPTAVEPP